MQNWDDLKFCLALGRHKTMSGAARSLGTNTATVSRRLDRLAIELQAQLFVRDGQSWAPTALTRTLIAAAEKVESNLMDVLGEHQFRGVPAFVHLSAELPIFQTEIARVMAQLLNSFDHIDFEFSMYPGSLALGETDLLLTYQRPSEGRVIRSKVTEQEFGLYVDKSHAGDPVGWIRVILDKPAEAWYAALEAKFGTTSRGTLHGLNFALQIMRQHPLACPLPKSFAENQPDLRQIPMDSKLHLPIWLSYHESRRHDPVLRNLVIWLHDQMAKA